MTSEVNDRSFLYLFLEPVREYLADDAVSEILINGPERVYIERSGKLEEVPARLPDGTRKVVEVSGEAVGLVV